MMVSAMAFGVTPGGGVHRNVHSSGRPGALRSGLMETVVGSGPPVGSSMVRTGTSPIRNRRVLMPELVKPAATAARSWRA
jgi:hypothetical protein